MHTRTKQTETGSSQARNFVFSFIRNMSSRTSILFVWLLLALNDVRAGKDEYHRRKHDHDFHFNHYHYPDEDDIYRSSPVFHHQIEPDPFKYNHYRHHEGDDPQRPHGIPPGHQNRQKPCDFTPPGQRGKVEGFPGRGRGPPCPVTPGPSFSFTSTQPPSFIDVTKPEISDVNRDFNFPIVHEIPNELPYKIHGYTENNFPVIVLYKSDIRK